MVVVGSRRALLSVASTSAFITLQPQSDWSISLSSLPKLLCSHTPRAFRNAVAATGCFLYRGEATLVTNQGAGATLLDPAPDLLLSGTYDDPSALGYFQCLETLLQRRQSVSRPSTGHIATSDAAEASRWGQAFSVWPLGDSISYVWPRQDKVFFPSSGSTNDCPPDIDLAIDQDLNWALKLGHEVLFTSSFRGNDSLPAILKDRRAAAFLAVPIRFDEILRDIAKSAEFTLAL